jgi:hypothetical protein
MRLLIGAGTQREAAARALAYVFVFYTDKAVTIILVAASYGFAVMVTRSPMTQPDQSGTSATGC